MIPSFTMRDRPMRPHCFGKDLPQRTSQSLQRLESLANKHYEGNLATVLPQVADPPQWVQQVRLNHNFPLDGSILSELHRFHLLTNKAQAMKWAKIQQYITVTRGIQNAIRQPRGNDVIQSLSDPRYQPQSYLAGLRLRLLWEIFQ